MRLAVISSSVLSILATVAFAQTGANPLLAPPPSPLVSQSRAPVIQDTVSPNRTMTNAAVRSAALQAAIEAGNTKEVLVLGGTAPDFVEAMQVRDHAGGRRSALDFMGREGTSPLDPANARFEQRADGLTSLVIPRLEGSGVRMLLGDQVGYVIPGGIPYTPPPPRPLGPDEFRMGDLIVKIYTGPPPAPK